MIRWGIIGCGSVTEVKSGPALQQVAGSELVAVMRRNPELAADYARRHRVPRWYQSAQQLIEDPQVDAVYIATPPGSHRDLALQVCAAGKPAYVEKPIARSYREACEMVEAFERRGVPLFVAYYRRALDRFVRAQEAVQADRIGPVASVVVTQTRSKQLAPLPQPVPWRLLPEYSGGGLFLDLGCHTLDALDFLLGPLQDVVGRATRRGSQGPEERVVLQFSTADGALGVGHFDYATPVYEDSITLFGSLGRLSMSTFGDDPVELVTAGGTEHFGAPKPRHVQGPLIETIVAKLEGTGECPSTGESAARTAQVIDRVLESFYRGRDDAFWQRPQSWGGV